MWRDRRKRRWSFIRNGCLPHQSLQVWKSMMYQFLPYPLKLAEMVGRGGVPDEDPKIRTARDLNFQDSSSFIS